MYDIMIHIGGDFLIDMEDYSDYSGLVETLYLSSIPDMKEKIVEGLNTSLEDCIPEDQVEW